jgi:hypothetical protein
MLLAVPIVDFLFHKDHLTFPLIQSPFRMPPPACDEEPCSIFPFERSWFLRREPSEAKPRLVGRVMLVNFSD